MTGIVIAVLLGIAGRTLIPYLEELRANPETKWERKFLIPPMISLVIGLLVSPLVLASIPPDQLNATTLPGLAAVFASAWGLTDIARSGQKLVSKPAEK